VKAQKEAALQNLITQMYDMMAEGKGDEPMAEDDLSESIEESADGPMGDDSKLMDMAMGDEIEDCDFEDEKSDFMKSKVDRPKRKSISVMAVRAKPAPKMDMLKEVMSGKKAKGKKYG